MRGFSLIRRPQICPEHQRDLFTRISNFQSRVFSRHSPVEGKRGRSVELGRSRSNSPSSVTSSGILRCENAFLPRVDADLPLPFVILEFSGVRVKAGTAAHIIVAQSEHTYPYRCIIQGVKIKASEIYKARG